MHTERFFRYPFRRGLLFLMMFMMAAAVFAAETTSASQVSPVTQTAQDLPVKQSVPTEPEKLDILR